MDEFHDDNDEPMEDLHDKGIEQDDDKLPLFVKIAVVIAVLSIIFVALSCIFDVG